MNVDTYDVEVIAAAMLEHQQETGHRGCRVFRENMNWGFDCEECGASVLFVPPSMADADIPITHKRHQPS